MWPRRRAAIADPDWAAALDALPVLAPLDDGERARLRALAARFAAKKSIETADAAGAAGGRGGLEPAGVARLAALACLPVLELGLDAYAPWSSIVVYPAGFLARDREVDEAGVEHEWEEARVGESWFRGPVVLSWEDVEASGRGGGGDGYNVVVHEMAHKLDMLDGGANGRPPLHRGMDPRAWYRDLSAAFEDLNRRLAAGEEPPIDDYAAEDPGEFFAVASEWFFELPDALAAAYPAVYAQLRGFYRQDPRARLARLERRTRPAAAAAGAAAGAEAGAGPPPRRRPASPRPHGRVAHNGRRPPPRGGRPAC